jgi:Amt family ammonium transporter
MSFLSVVPYNGTNDAGGDSLTDNLNLFYDAGDIAWIITASALVLLMVPGVG